MDRSSPLEDLKERLQKFGVTARPGPRDLRFAAVSGLLDLSFACIILATVLMFFQPGVGLLDLGEAMQCFVSAVPLIGKTFNLRFRAGLFWKMIHDAETTWNQMATDTRNLPTLNQTRREMKLANVVILSGFVLPVPLFGIMSMVQNMLVEPEERKLLFQIWDPVAPTLGPQWYWLRIIWEFVLILIGHFVFYMVTITLLQMTLMARGQIMVLVSMLEDDGVDIIACVKMHQRIIMYLRDFNELFASLSALEIVLAAVQIAARGLQLIQLLKDNDPRTLEVGIFLILCVSGPFMVCFSGQILTNMSEMLYRSAFNKNWYNLSLSDQKAVYLMNLQASRIINLEYRQVIQFNMERYAMVCQGTYSFLTLLTSF